MSTNEALAPVAHLAHLPHLADMAVFARVVEAGSFSGAARVLGTTPSAVSKQVARLEGLLRVRLLERTTRKLRLTEAGHAAYGHCQALEAAARDVMQLADQHTHVPQGLVRMSAPKAYGRQRIHPLVAPFLAAHPQVDVQLVVTDRVVDLFAEDVDLAIHITDTSTRAGGAPAGGGGAHRVRQPRLSGTARHTAAPERADGARLHLPGRRPERPALALYAARAGGVGHGGSARALRGQPQ